MRGVDEVLSDDMLISSGRRKASHRESIFDYLPDTLKTEEFYLCCVRINGAYLQDVPEHLRSYELCLEAVKNNGNALEFVDANMLSTEEYKEICGISGENNEKSEK
jgi:hypothetical protein